MPAYKIVTTETGEITTVGIAIPGDTRRDPAEVLHEQLEAEDRARNPDYALKRVVPAAPLASHACPHCSFSAAGAQGLSAHIRARHSD